MYYIVASYGLLTGFLLQSRLIMVFPWYHTYRTGYIAAFLLMPLSFFYIRSLMQQKRFRLFDLIHFLPASIFIIDFIPFYFQSAEYKLQQLEIDSRGINTSVIQFSQGWLGIGFIYVPLRIALTLVYWAWQVRMILHAGKIKDGQSLVTENKNIMLWAKIFCGSQVLLFLPYYVNAFFGDQQNVYFLIHVLLAVSVSMTILALILQPSILYGLKGVVIRKFNNDKEGNGSEVPTITQDHAAITGHGTEKIDVMHLKTVSENVSHDTYLSAKKLNNLGERLVEHFSLNHTYLKKGYTSSNLAAEMNMQPYILSAVINQVFRTNFNDFINGYRVDHAKTLIENGEARLLTLEALSEQCGFRNRNSFTMAFKKHAGQTPSDFIKLSSSKN